MARMSITADELECLGRGQDSRMIGLIEGKAQTGMNLCEALWTRVQVENEAERLQIVLQLAPRWEVEKAGQLIPHLFPPCIYRFHYSLLASGAQRRIGHARCAQKSHERPRS